VVRRHAPTPENDTAVSNARSRVRARRQLMCQLMPNDSSVLQSIRRYNVCRGARWVRWHESLHRGRPARHVEPAARVSALTGARPGEATAAAGRDGLQRRNRPEGRFGPVTRLPGDAIDPTHPTSSFGISYQADVHFKMVFSLCGRSTAATRSRSRLPRSKAGCQRPCPPRLSKPDAVLSCVPGTDRGDADCHAPEAGTREGGMAVVSHPTLGDRHQSRRELWIAGSVHPGVPKCFRRFTEPLSPHGCDVHSPPRDEWNSPPFL